jgi:hypothetical protein
MFGIKNYGFVEEATEENLNGKGNVWKFIQEWKPFIKYKRTDFIDETATGKHLYTIDICRCPKWVYDVINKQLQFVDPKRRSYTSEITVNEETGKIISK